MDNPEDEVIPNTRPSCTENEIVARLIGWLGIPMTRRYIEVTEEGIEIDQMPFLASLYESLDTYLYELREGASRALWEAAERSASIDILEQKEKAVTEIDELIRKVFAYRLDVADEAAREPSALLIDRRATEQTKVCHYTLPSVDRWARKKYGLSIIDGGVEVGPSDPALEAACDDDRGGAEDGYSKQVVDSLRVSFALLVEDIAVRAPAFNSGGQPNAKVIATYLSDRAPKHGKRAVRGQGAESIRKRIAAALNAKNEMLRDM